MEIPSAPTVTTAIFGVTAEVTEDAANEEDETRSRVVPASCGVSSDRRASLAYANDDDERGEKGAAATRPTAFSSPAEAIPSVVERVSGAMGGEDGGPSGENKDDWRGKSVR